MGKRWTKVARPGKHIASRSIKGEAEKYQEFDAKYLEGVAESGKALLEKGALIPIPVGHTPGGKLPKPLTNPPEDSDSEGPLDFQSGKPPKWDPKENTGFVTDYKYEDDWLWAEIDIQDEEIDKALGKTIRGTSIGISPAFDLPGGERIKNAPFHLALTNRPGVWGQDGFLPAPEDQDPLSLPEKHEVVLMSEEGVEERFLLMEEGDTEMASDSGTSDAQEHPAEQTPENPLPEVMDRLCEALISAGLAKKESLEGDKDPIVLLEKVIAIIANSDLGNGESPFGPPPEETEEEEAGAPILMETKTIVAKALTGTWKNDRRARVQALIEKGSVKQAYADKELFPEIDSVENAPILMSEEGEVLLAEDGSPAFETTLVDKLLIFLEENTTALAEPEGTTTEEPPITDPPKGEVDTDDPEYIDPEVEKILAASSAGLLNQRVPSF